MSFAAFLSTTGGLLGLWNNLSINDLQYYCWIWRTSFLELNSW
jgi:hypothetical protein